MGRTKTTLGIFDTYVALDVETTGLSPRYCDVIEVGAVKYHKGEAVSEFQTLARPKELPIPQFIESLTGIKSEDLENAPMPSAVAKDLMDYIGDLPILGHNICFDIAFVESILNEPIGNALVDTKRISMHVLDGLESKRLDDVVSECGRIKGERFAWSGRHRAVADCEATAFAYEAMKPLLVEKYGEDPEAGYGKQRKNGHQSAPQKKAKDFEPTVEVSDDNPFYGSMICFTGKLESMTRSEAMQLAVNCGAIPRDNVVKKLDYLVVGSFDFVSSLKGDKSSKLKKAEDLIAKGSNLQIIDERFFVEQSGL